MDGELGRSLKISLERLERGDSVAACLAGFPQHAADLEPMLIAAQALMSLHGQRLSEENRREAKARLRGALAIDPGTTPAHGFLRRLLGRRAARPAANQGYRPYGPRLAWAGLIVALLCVTLSAGIVAASQPGEAAYPLRVAAERWPVYLQTSPEARAAAWLDVADRRLGDLESSLARDGRPDPTALAALLASEDAGAQVVDALPAGEQAAAAARVAAQAGALARLAQQTPGAEAAGTLVAASQRAFALATRLGYRPPPPPAPPATAIPAPATDEPATSTPVPTATAVHTAGPRDDRGPQATGAGRTPPGAGDGTTGGPRAGMTAEPGSHVTATPHASATAPATDVPSVTHTPMAQSTPESRPTPSQAGSEAGSGGQQAGGPQSGSQDSAPADDHGSDGGSGGSSAPSGSGSGADSGSGGSSGSSSGGSRH